MMAVDLKTAGPSMDAISLPSVTDAQPRTSRVSEARTFRVTVIGLLAVAVLAPVGLIVYQSFLDGAFFSPASQLSAWTPTVTS